MSQPSDGNNCLRLEPLLEAYVDGDLSELELTAVELHLDACGACREQHQLALAIRAELRVLPQMDAPRVVLERVVETARAGEAARSFSAWRLWRSWPALAGVLAAAALAMVVLLPSAWRDEGPSISSAESTLVQPATAEVDAAAIRQAADEARLALAYVSLASRRTGLEIRDELIVERLAVPTARGLRLLGRRHGDEERSGNET